MASRNTVPDYQNLMPLVLQLAAHGEVRVRDAVQELAETLGLDAEARALLLPSGRQTLFANRVHWAKTYLAKAGLIKNTRRGFFQITERGKKALQVPPGLLNNDYLSQFEEFRHFQGRPEDAQVDEMTVELGATDGKAALTPDELIRLTHQQLEATLAQDLLDRIAASSPEFFERLIVNLLLAMGYGGSVTDAGRALGASGDNGIDGVIDQDPLGLDRVYIQAKRYAPNNPVGSGAVRDFFGSLDRHKASKGLFVTTSSFTGSARETAEFLSKRIVLIEGTSLARLMIRYNVGCRIEQTILLKNLDEDFFE